jgi:flagellar basal-body rod protein FlgB
MTDKITFSNTLRVLENAINVAHKRNSLMAGNISNIDTPGYKSRDIDFKSAMAQAINADNSARLAKTNSAHMGMQTGSSQELEVFEEDGEWNGYNWMNSEQVMTKLTENSLIYRTATEALLRKFNILKEVIREGGR